MISLPCMVAALENETAKVDAAYDCLNSQVRARCSELTSEERIFSAMTLEECTDEVLADSVAGECWPSSGCSITTTAQAILALEGVGEDTTAAQDWLGQQSIIPSELTWYLEIESTEATSCSIGYDGSNYDISIGTDKKINSGAGSCLSLSTGDYWLEIDQACYNQEFTISCDQGFLTTLLFTKSDSPSTIHVLEETHSASAGGSTTEIVDSLCFSLQNSCDYEGTMWGVAVLDSLGYDMSAYMPYLITMADENEEYIPYSFLYFLTEYSDFFVKLLDGQKSNKWWSESGDEYYDTALALLPLQPSRYDNLEEKLNAMQWLLDVQDNDGCWGNKNIVNTAFILYSIWPRTFEPSVCGDGIIQIGEECEGTNLGSLTSNNCSDYNSGYDAGTISCSSTCKLDLSNCEGDAGVCGNGILEANEQCDNESFGEWDECSDLSGYISGNLTCDDDCTFNTLECVREPSSDDLDCEDMNYFCRSDIACKNDGGNILDYFCSGISSCCSQPEVEENCADVGEICSSSGESCDGGKWGYGYPDVGSDQKCCVSGTCKDEPQTSTSDCVVFGGTCKSQCGDNEEESFYTCDFGDTCCVAKTKSGFNWWILILILLIVLILIAILFREKLRPYWIRIKSKFSKEKSKPSFGRPGFPPRPPTGRLMPRRILPPTQRAPPTQRPSSQKPRGEIDNVLKKLKEMGK